MIYTDYLQRHIDRLTEAQKLYSEILREEMRAEKGEKV
ncbi:hypothetical protein LCGC14_2141000 [marine sediment metagenome]|uniref:Uncharacterized protein n=1 Tax=marine sediment metagenome TaxID=412755 RepID=A0A0F9EKQ1_9ZZZZ